tara:strand:+ start:392 stop:538 length:147 start_codon:yes stop_codon:yes gene_type:complete
MVSHIKHFLKAVTFIEAIIKQQIQEAEKHTIPTNWKNWLILKVLELQY